jgi:indolepyruvate ferredoxin oxidoreductase alpha subunit
MGASVTMAVGAAKAGMNPAVAVIGDSTFTHSGMTGLLDAVNQKANILVMILDNGTTAMTGGQDSAAHNKLQKICIGLGVEPEHIHILNPIPRKFEENLEVIKNELEYEGVSVVIPERECIKTLGRRRKTESRKKQLAKS